ncbi:MAG: peptidoglycan-binding protein [Pseudomonadota bacterium]
MKILPRASLCAALALSGCGINPVVTSANIDPISLASAPPGAAAGTCWDRTTTPAVVETQTRKILLQPAQISSDGRVQQPPVYKDETQQVVVEPRRESWIEIPCPQVLTPDFVAALQRALAARGHFDGPVTGRIDLRTRMAVHSYQRAQGLDKPELTVATARQLGLITVDLPQET